MKAYTELKKLRKIKLKSNKDFVDFLSSDRCLSHLNKTDINKELSKFNYKFQGLKKKEIYQKPMLFIVNLIQHKGYKCQCCGVIEERVYEHKRKTPDNHNLTSYLFSDLPRLFEIDIFNMRNEKEGYRFIDNFKSYVSIMKPFCDRCEKAIRSKASGDLNSDLLGSNVDMRYAHNRREKIKSNKEYYYNASFLYWFSALTRSRKIYAKN
jgi:hypothetical protein